MAGSLYSSIVCYSKDWLYIQLISELQSKTHSKAPAHTMYLSLHITPKAAKNAITGWAQDAEGRPVLKVRVAAPPEDGKANAELLRFLAKSWGLRKSDITLVAGDTSRHKRIEIQGTIPEELRANVTKP
jgi:uncharacterized protein